MAPLTATTRTVREVSTIMTMLTGIILNSHASIGKMVEIKTIRENPPLILNTNKKLSTRAYIAVTNIWKTKRVKCLWLW